MGVHLLLSLSFVGQLAPSFFSLFMIFLIRNFLPLLHFLEHGVQGDHPVTIQSDEKSQSQCPNSLNHLSYILLKLSLKNLALIKFIFLLLFLIANT